MARIKHFGRSKPLLKKQLFGARKVVFFEPVGENKACRGLKLLEKTTFRSPKSCFLICNWKGLPLQWRSGQLEKAPEKLRACSQECLEGKMKKQLFGAWKVVFFNLQFGRVSLLQWRSGQLEKAPEKLRACSQECLEGKMKKQLFGAWKVVFFKFAIWKGLPFAVALWAAGKAICPWLCSPS